MLPRNGFLGAVRLILRLECDSLISAGLPCTSYVWVNQGTHGRSSARPLGNCHLDYVKEANTSSDTQGSLCLFAVCAVCLSCVPSCCVSSFQAQADDPNRTSSPSRDSEIRLLAGGAAQIIPASCASRLGLPCRTNASFGSPVSEAILATAPGTVRVLPSPEP